MGLDLDVSFFNVIRSVDLHPTSLVSLINLVYLVIVFGYELEMIYMYFVCASCASKDLGGCAVSIASRNINS